MEAPGTGDLGRTAQPAMADPEGRGVGATFMRNNLSKRSVGHRPEATGGTRPRPAPGATLRRRGRELPRRCGRAARGGVRRRGGGARPGGLPVHLRASGARCQAGAATSPYDGWPALASIVEAMSGAYEFKRTDGAAADRLRPWGGWATSSPRSSPSSARWPRCANATGRDGRSGSTWPCSTPWWPCSTSCPTSGRWACPMGTPVAGHPARLRAADGWFMLQVLRAAPVAGPGPGDRPARVGRRPALRHAPGLARAPRVGHPPGHRVAGPPPSPSARPATRSTPPAWWPARWPPTRKWSPIPTSPCGTCWWSIRAATAWRSPC